MRGLILTIILLISINCKAQNVTYEQLFEYFKMSIKDVEDRLTVDGFKRQPITQEGALVRYPYFRESRKNPILIEKVVYVPSPLENINYGSVFITINDDYYREFSESIGSHGYQFVRTMNSDESTLTHYYSNDKYGIAFNIEVQPNRKETIYAIMLTDLLLYEYLMEIKK